MEGEIFFIFMRSRLYEQTFLFFFLLQARTMTKVVDLLILLVIPLARFQNPRGIYGQRCARTVAAEVTVMAVTSSSTKIC